jgi:hypothetical protein
LFVWERSDWHKKDNGGKSKRLLLARCSISERNPKTFGLNLKWLEEDNDCESRNSSLIARRLLELG